MPADAPTILAASMGFNRARDPWEPGPIFRFAFELAGSPAHPKACFVSTGTGDRQQSVDHFYAAFADTDVRPSHLALFDKPNVEDIREHLLDQDVVWVDRGSLANLLAVWRVHELDRVMRECWQAGVVLGGESAGSLCWHSGGTTDSFGPVRCLDDGLRFLPYSNAVHYADRRELHLGLIARGELPDGYATDAGAGLYFRDTEFIEAVADRSGAKAYWLERQPDGTAREAVIEPRRLKR
ncbi:Type 1 glutamine amidotransferase-like domain-containing protein [Amycolatopsis pigmentata]|uniref:Type 1 glutamine amidotransferase-like domain-containing protein n=1 Tax=Amycolatopsis pigmentata TaxID=450801 RepID=A0ABW5FLM2_9PSEU